MRGKRVVVADDHPLFVRAVVAALEAASIDVVGTAPNGTELLALAGRVELDAALVDMHMPVCDGLTCIRELRRRHEEVMSIAISADGDPALVDAALANGAACWISKAIDPRDLAGVVHALLLDTVHVASSSRRGVTPATVAGLTPRECEILLVACSGITNREIARSLWVTEQTVKFHLSNVYRKIGVSNRVQASAWAREHGLLDGPPSREAAPHRSEPLPAAEPLGAA